METSKPEAQAIIEFAERVLEPSDVELETEGQKVVAVPKGVELKSLKAFHDEWLPAPRRRQGVSIHKTLASLVDWVNRFKSEQSVLFADPGDAAKPVLQAVINYNPAGPVDDDDQKTDWGDHRGRYAFPLSDQWAAWKAVDGKKQTVREFSRFIERQIEDIGDPADAGKIAKQIPEKLGFALATPAQVLTLSKGLSLVVDHTVTNVFDPNTGEMRLQFEQKHKDHTGKPLDPIKAFLLLIPVFQGGTVYPVGVRLLYEVDEGSVLFTTQLYREDLFFKDAFETACEVARGATQLPLYFGSPEQ